MCYTPNVNAQRIARVARVHNAHERRTMFDEWLRLFWKTFLWWLPGANDEDTTSHGKGDQSGNESQTSTATAKTGTTTGGGQATSAGRTRTTGADSTSGQAKGGSGGQATDPSPSGSGAGQDGSRAKSGAQAKSGGTSSGQSKSQGKAKGSSANGGGDDLTAIKGIGPKVAETLRGLGITSFSDLAEADPADLAAKVNQRPVTAKRVQDWIAEARSRAG